MLGLLVACAVCATADPTLVVAGEEQPYRGRLRLSLDFREGRVLAGDVSVDDHRLELAVTWAPLRWLELAFAAPYLFRHVEDPTASENEATLGDVELRVRTLAYEARGSFGRRAFGLLGSLKFPTAPIGYDPSGVPLASTLQPGCGSVAPALGVYYATSRGAWSTYVSASLYLPFSVRDGPHSSDSARVAAHLQYQIDPHVGGRLGVFGRLDASGQLSSTADDPNSGGFVGYLTGDVVVSLAPDLVLTAGVLMPVVQALRGVHHESAIAAVTAAYDF